MLPSQKRLSRTLFTAFLAQSGTQSIYNKLGTLKFIQSQEMRVSVVTSSKHQKHAVGRNTLRRRMYTLFQSFPVPITGVLYVSKQSYTLSYDEIKTLFNDLTARVQKAAK